MSNQTYCYEDDGECEACRSFDPWNCEKDAEGNSVDRNSCMICGLYKDDHEQPSKAIVPQPPDHIHVQIPRYPEKVDIETLFESYIDSIMEDNPTWDVSQCLTAAVNETNKAMAKMLEDVTNMWWIKYNV